MLNIKHFARIRGVLTLKRGSQYNNFIYDINLLQTLTIDEGDANKYKMVNSSSKDISLYQETII